MKLILLKILKYIFLLKNSWLVFRIPLAASDGAQSVG